ncbi:hypothetical protein [Bacillus niameyensis]|uniref:hypothetical protein n=1 Tax=Bacillus niameyensis TaxID=1522308 RepID=UPI000784D223|nr:hypothetical protein [Bacillus niameyensis]
MKRLIISIVSLVVIYSVYHDLTAGTIPASSAIVQTNLEEQKTALDPFIELEIASGDTVISIMEERLAGPLPIPISQLVKDFERLNNGTKPEQIQIGKSYKFPIYQ